MKTSIVKIMFMLSVMALLLPLSASAQQGSLRWKLKSVETRWKESRLTGASFDVRTKETTTVVNVKVSKVKLKDGYVLRFERSKMRDEKDTDFEAIFGEIDFDSRDELLTSLNGILRRMNKIPKEDNEEVIFSKDDIEATYFVEHGKQRLEMIFSDSTFVLEKKDVELFINRLKSIR